MSDHAVVYDGWERTGNPRPSVHKARERLLDRVTAPRTDHSNAHPNETVATVADRYNGAVVRTAIHRILFNGARFCTAAAEHDMTVLGGVRIGTVNGLGVK